MQKVSLVDETFDLNFTLEYFLSIQVSLDGFSFCILDSIQNKVVYLFHQNIFAKEPGFQLKKIQTIYDEVDVLSLPYKKTTILYSAPDKTTLVPASVFSPELASSFLQMTIEADNQSRCLYSFVPELDSYALSEISEPLHAWINEKHPGIEIIPEIKIATSNLSSEAPLLKVTTLSRQLVILGINGELKFYNCFNYEGENDMLYYILGAVKSMETEPTTVVLDGIINKHSAIYHRLRQYFEQVTIAPKNPEIHYSYLIERLPDARFHNLFKSFSCAL